MLFVLGTVLISTVPGSDEADSRIVSYYDDGGNQLKLELAATLAIVFFLWFLGVLVARLREVESESPWLSVVALVSGGAFAVCTLSGLALETMVAVSANANTAFEIDANTTRLLNDAVYLLTFETALPLAAPLVLAASLILSRSELTPRWFVRAGFVVALGCIVGFLGIPMLLFLAWVALVVYYLIRRPLAAGTT